VSHAQFRLLSSVQSKNQEQRKCIYRNAVRASSFPLGFQAYRLSPDRKTDQETGYSSEILPCSLSPARCKRLLKAFDPYTSGSTHDDLERFLDVRYGMFSDVSIMAELRQIVVSDPFDRSAHPRQFKLVELTDWSLEMTLHTHTMRHRRFASDASRGGEPLSPRSGDSPLFVHSWRFFWPCSFPREPLRLISLGPGMRVGR
jgi:hypothetical protein